MKRTRPIEPNKFNQLSEVQPIGLKGLDPAIGFYLRLLPASITALRLAMSPARGPLPQYIWQGLLWCLFALWGLSEYQVELSHCVGSFFDTAAILCNG